MTPLSLVPQEGRQRAVGLLGGGQGQGRVVNRQQQRLWGQGGYKQWQ